MSTEREDLDNLVKSPGWQRVQAWAKTEYREQVAQATDIAVSAANDTEALSKLRQVLAARKAVDFAMEWPDIRLRQIRELEERNAGPYSPQRGGL